MFIRTKVLLLVAAFLLVACQRTDPYTNWQIYKGDAESTSYSALDQINTENVNQLEVAWTFYPQDTPENVRLPKYECNPIIIGDIMYTTSARHWIYALDAGTGQKIWSFNPFDPPGGDRGAGIKRGVTYWEDGDDKRILFTAGEELFALDALTGTPILEFGIQGRVRLDTDLGMEPDSVWVIPTSPGIVYRNLLILGSEVAEVYGAAPGDIRAFDIPTGELKWTFHTIPRPGEPGYETWPEDAWKYAGGANNWGGMSLDMGRGIVYVPLGSPSYDYYGANRTGQNLYGNCIVALDAATGNRIWHFQTVHHDLWDYDLPAPPNLVAVERGGRKIDAVAQTTKTGFLFVLDRETGEPLFPVEERPVPASVIPGEKTWPTQPFPLKPAPYSRQHMTLEDLTAFSPEDNDFITRRFSELRYEGMFTPPDLRGTLMVPGSRGGSEWGGGAFDPATGILYINANESPEIANMVPASSGKKKGRRTAYASGKRFYTQYCATCHGVDRNGLEPDFPSLIDLRGRKTELEVLEQMAKGVGKMPAFANILEGNEEEIIAYLFEIQDGKMVQTEAQKEDSTSGYLNITAYGYFRDAAGRPALKPPWGTLNAINLNTGEYAWKITLGNDPELQQERAPDTGTENWGGPMVTAGGLVFIGATRDNKFRVFDKKTGDLLWETVLPGGGHATPATYLSDGKQYVTISVSGSKEAPGGHIRAFALPD